MQTSPARTQRLAALRAEVRAIECAGSARSEAFMPFGIEGIDRRLAGGGLAAAALHEVAGAAPGLADDAAATLFTRRDRRPAAERSRLERCCGRCAGPICSLPAWLWPGSGRIGSSMPNAAATRTCLR